MATSHTRHTMRNFVPPSMPKYENAKMMAARMSETIHHGMAMPSSCSMMDEANVPPADTRYTDSRL